jgi:thiamine-phosphate pyrophosphorylase
MTGMALDPSRRFPLMCITQDLGPMPPVEQAARLCSAGARWIQLRMKGAPQDEWLAAAHKVVAICRNYGAICIINDSVEIALQTGADGAHLGHKDMDWIEARRLLGPDRILGGTVNRTHEAEKAARAGCLDYVGVGPLRFTRTKKDLAPLQGFDGIRTFLSVLGGIPAWAIGGIELGDVPEIRAMGAAGVAVCSALLRNGTINENVGAFLNAWPFGGADNQPAQPIAIAPNAGES